MKKIRVLLADDQILFVESLKTVLETRASNIDVIGIVYNGREVLDFIEKERPDLILLDIRMPEVNGVECSKIISEKYPGIIIMILTTFDDDEYIIEALKYGATGYLLKDVPPSFLIDAINSVYNGGMLISPKIAQKIVTRLNNPIMNRKSTDKTDSQHDDSVIETLTVRECEILAEISKGYTNKEIAHHFFIAEQTVKNHVSTIYSKLNIHDRMHAFLVARKAGLE